MADFRKYFQKLLRHEGGYVNHPSDPGGHTNKGITLATWQNYGNDKDGDGDIDVNDLKIITDQDAYDLYKQIYWDKIGGDQIVYQPLAEIMFDHGVNAGQSRAVKMIQYLLNEKFGKNLEIDGGMGPITMNALNRANGPALYNAYIDLRKDYYTWRANYQERVSPARQRFFKEELNVSPSTGARVFYAGWLNRLSSFEKKKIAVGAGGLLLLGSGLFLYRLSKKRNKKQTQNTEK